MSKELTPLEALERIKNAPTIYVGCASDIYTRYSFECKEIETALKRLEQIEINQSIFENNPITVGKKIMALEIIKLKQVNVCSFIQRNPNTFEEYQNIDDEIEQLSEVSLSQEEYDLLKEVLK